jgi:hypothetical protein
LVTLNCELARVKATEGDPADFRWSGRRIDWVENANGHGRILSLELSS